jgi:peptidoglycan pentaglycine glycine transferase (the first glycine)
MALLNLVEWDDFLSGYPNAHILQTSAWGELKAAFGWSAVRLVQGETGAQVLFRRLPLWFNLAYIPRGPVGLEWKTLLPALDNLCREQRCVFIKIEPDLWETSGETPNPPKGFQAGKQTIQPRRTLLVDLAGDEQRLLARMKQKTRYNIHLAQKKGVVVRPSADLELFYRLMEKTGERDRFGVHSLDYFRRAYGLFYPQGECELLLAELQGQPLAALMVFAHGRRAWYFYGASANEHREAMPTYLLQWEAMRWAERRGCVEYDLWGVPDADEATLEANFEQRKDGLWGVYRFKRGFGGQLCRSSAPWDRVYNPVLYAFYRFWTARRPQSL